MKLFIIDNWKRLLAGVLIIGATGVLGMAGYIYNIYHSPIMSNDAENSSIIMIPRGSTFDSVTADLREKGMLPHPRLYRYLSKQLKVHSRVQSGEFEIKHRWNTYELLQFLISGKSIRHRITIPEGNNFAEIAERLFHAQLADKEILMSLKNDPELLLKTGVPEATSLEGFLFPETYFFSSVETEQQILSAMIAQYRRVFNADFQQRAEEIGMREYEVLTLASIVEKETGIDADRPMIASVFHNRLKRRMRLDSDPSVIYGLKDFNGNLTRKHLRARTPYNTYRRYGLPPTPISNPGRASLQSVLYPAEEKYLYFVARGDGSSKFSKTLREHNKAVWYFQKVRKNRQAMSRKRKQASSANM
ncbi:MAG TPA: endolytic transglycosylase MltG [Deltaproteobacteria bacterium]|nr:endolytic transglycosylase MltG [Deltaproteobacteria bacterium]